MSRPRVPADRRALVACAALWLACGPGLKSRPAPPDPAIPADARPDLADGSAPDARDEAPPEVAPEAPEMPDIPAADARDFATVDAPASEAGPAYPGDLVTDPATRGAGPCATRTLAELAAAIRADRPALADFTTFAANPGAEDAGKQIVAFATPTGFALAFRANAGECLAGVCSYREVTYFATDAGCQPVTAGYYLADLRREPQHPAGCWYLQAGEPLWSVPPLPARAQICSPADVTGTHRVRGPAVATVDCATAPSPRRWNADVTMVVTQVGPILRIGTVTLTGTGHPRIDGRALPATFKDKSFTLKGDRDDPRAPDCRITWVEGGYDFHAGQGRIAVVEEYGSIGRPCPGPPLKPCRDEINLDLAPAP